MLLVVTWVSVSFLAGEAGTNWALVLSMALTSLLQPARFLFFHFSSSFSSLTLLEEEDPAGSISSISTSLVCCYSGCCCWRSSCCWLCSCTLVLRCQLGLLLLILLRLLLLMGNGCRFWSPLYYFCPFTWDFGGFLLVPFFSLLAYGWSCGAGFFPRHNFERYPAAPHDQQWGLRQSTTI